MNRRRRRMIRVLAAAAVAAAAGLGAAQSQVLVDQPHPTGGVGPVEVSTAPTRTTTAPVPDGPLTVGEVAYRSDYDRDAFGQAWSDDVDVDGGRNGCDTRNDQLRQSLVDVEVRPGTNGCVVVAGRLDPEPYTGQPRTFTKAKAHQLQVDHVFALAAAWDAGAWAWSDDERRNFANDPLNLIVADGPLNQAKGAATPAEWLPPNPAFRCPYSQRFAAVAVKYSLTVTAADPAAITGACG